MPRNDAAERYSPDTAAAFTVGEIRRDATRKSDVVRMAATPRAPINSVISNTGTIARITEPPGDVPVRGAPLARPCAAATRPAAPTAGTAAPRPPTRRPGSRRTAPYRVPGRRRAPAAAPEATRPATPTRSARTAAAGGESGGRARRRPGRGAAARR